jgi:hypothetical protein
MVPNDGFGPALRGIGPRLRGIAACTLGLMLALCLAGLAGRLAFDTVAAALGFVAGGGLIASRAVVCAALARTGPHGRSSRHGSSGAGGPDRAVTPTTLRGPIAGKSDRTIGGMLP